MIMDMRHWILDENGSPTPVDLMTWAKWFEISKNRIVRRDIFNNIKVSTVFLGIDHNFNRGGPPVLWETMVFGGKLDQEQDRCSGNREQAEAMHAAMVKRVQETL